MHRFFLPPDAFQSGRVAFPREAARQIHSVLRLKAGQEVTALDGLGREYRVVLEQVDREGVIGVVTEASINQAEPAARLGLLVALTQREKFEWILQKCTEVGVSEFQPIITERSLVQRIEENKNRLERWRAIVQEAAEQCGRGRVPVVQYPLNMYNAIEAAATGFDLCLAAWEKEETTGLPAALRSYQPGRSIAVLIGPEGGFSEKEIDAARSAGFHSITLGKRILRMETAAVVACALILHEVER